jgi:hypothetical protein
MSYHGRAEARMAIPVAILLQSVFAVSWHSFAELVQAPLVGRRGYTRSTRLFLSSVHWVFVKPAGSLENSAGYLLGGLLSPLPLLVTLDIPPALFLASLPCQTSVESTASPERKRAYHICVDLLMMLVD